MRKLSRLDPIGEVPTSKHAASKEMLPLAKLVVITRCGCQNMVLFIFETVAEYVEMLYSIMNRNILMEWCWHSSLSSLRLDST